VGKIVEMKKDGNGILHVAGKGWLANIRGSLDLKADKKLQGSMSGKRGEDLPPSYEEAMGGTSRGYGSFTESRRPRERRTADEKAPRR
jgi:hypothetical protein